MFSILVFPTDPVFTRTIVPASAALLTGAAFSAGSLRLRSEKPTASSV